MSTIRNQLHKGVKWTGASSLFITIIQIVQFALLANVMGAAEFGLVGMITTIVVFAQILIDLGLGSAVIQKERVTNRMLSTLFWLNMLVGILLFVVLMVASPLIASFFHEEELVPLVRLLAIMFLIAPIGQQSQYMLQKELRFNALAVVEIIATFLSFFTLIGLLFVMSPIYAYVISQVLFYALKGVLYFSVYLKTWRPGFVFRLAECKEILSFGGFQLASRLVNRIGSNLDVLLIGRFMGAEALGFYHLAYQVVTIPVLKINPILTRVAFPLFSKNQHDHNSLKEGFLHMSKLLALVSFPLLLGVIAVADVFIVTVFGKQWLPATEILQIMAIVGLLRVLMNPNGSVLLAKGKANLSFYWDTGVLLLYGLALWVAVQSQNLETVTWTYVTVSLVNFFIGRWLLAWLIQLSLKDYLQALSKPFILSITMMVGAFWIKEISARYLTDEAFWTMLLSVGGGAVVYLGLVSLAYPLLVKKGLRKLA
ncbi:MOP flippase family protein [Mesobacillus maritimus]|uniref:teichuronic acid biosynthesis protein TuaB n=1 Tax=Mesobacillus maritimus TaxID=1643336 RepID=UPI00203C2F71|nr:MOP flippase family protein [Mesobacillus maritimus]